MSDEKNHRCMTWLIVLAFVLLGSVCLGYAQAQHHAAKSGGAAAARTSGRGMHEGIKVHGHWSIEVRNPKGKLLSHTEFENSLVGGPFGGGSWLTYFFLQQAKPSSNSLGGSLTPGEWGILLGDPSSPPCSANLTTSFNLPSYGGTDILRGTFCVLTQQVPPAAIYPVGCGSGNEGCSYNLVVSNPFNGDGVNVLQLSGSVVSQSPGTISVVQTVLSYCEGNVAPSVCWSETAPDSNAFGGFFAFTQAGLPASNTTQFPCGGAGQISCAVNVPEAGDTINVQVSISFQ